MGIPNGGVISTVATPTSKAWAVPEKYSFPATINKTAKRANIREGLCENIVFPLDNCDTSYLTMSQIYPAKDYPPLPGYRQHTQIVENKQINNVPEYRNMVKNRTFTMEIKEVNQEETSLFESLRILFGRLLGGRVHFSKEYTGRILRMEDGKQFEVIRDLRVDTEQRSVDSVALFIVRFKFSGLPLAVNKRLSLIPVPFLIAKTGFHRKLWTIAEDGYFQGVYQWATKEFADEYPQSFIFKMMTRRSVEGTVSYEVIPDTVLSEYIENLLLS